MDCPAGLIYNPTADQCENSKNTESICDREQPCMNEGQCHQTSPSSFKCTCRAAWTGERCETPVSSCAAKPCGEENECQTLRASDYKQDYVCLCNERQSYGLSCGKSQSMLALVYSRTTYPNFFILDTVPNPCLAAAIEQEQYYSFAFSAQAFVQCNGEILYVQPCAAGLLWNQEAKVCDRPEAETRPINKDQSQGYQVTYGNEQQSAYARPTAVFAEKVIARPQQQQYQDYSSQKQNTKVFVDNQRPSSYGSAFNKIVAPRPVQTYNSYSADRKSVV